MKIPITFRQIEPTEGIKEYTYDKIRKVKKYLHMPVDAKVILRNERGYYLAEVTISAGKYTFKGIGKSQVIKGSIDQMMDKIERQIRRVKGKLKTKKGEEVAGREEVFLA
jgi:putative sigma-54 modulation protein